MSNKKLNYTPLIRLNVQINKNKVIGIYDSGSNITLVNSNIVKDIKEKIYKNEQTFKTISGVQKSYDKIK